MLEYNIIINDGFTSDSVKELKLLSSLLAPSSVEANRALSDLIILLKALYLPGLPAQSRLLSSTVKGAGLLCFRLLIALRSRLLPAGSLFWLLPAGSGTFMLLYYSGGQNGMHNVWPGFPRLCLGKLDLSNTSKRKKTLSFPKPPQRKSSFAAFLHVLDGFGFPGKGTEEPFRVPSSPCSALFRTVPSKKAYYRPWRPGSYLTRAGVNRLFSAKAALSFGLGGPRGPVPAR